MVGFPDDVNAIDDEPSLEPLTNARWGFESNCFVCEPRNDAGLGIAFSHDRRAGRVVARFSLDDRFSGAPSYIHGGVVLAVLDEAMAWATIALAGAFAVTKQTTTRFAAPVRVGRDYTVSARVIADDGREMECEAAVCDGDGTPCAEATATFVALGAARAVDAIGAEVTGDDARYVRTVKERSP